MFGTGLFCYSRHNSEEVCAKLIIWNQKLQPMFYSREFVIIVIVIIEFDCNYKFKYLLLLSI